MNHKRVERIWRREGLKVPKKQPKRGRLWLSDGSCIRLRSSWRNHVWAYDFVMTRTHDGRALWMLTVINEYTRECLAITTARKLKSDDVQPVPDGMRRKLRAIIGADMIWHTTLCKQPGERMKHII